MASVITQIIFLIIGFILGTITSLINLNIQSKKDTINKIKDWLCDIEEQQISNVDIFDNFERYVWLWSDGRFKELTLDLTRKNTLMLGLCSSKAIPESIRKPISEVIQKRLQCQDLFLETSTIHHSGNEITDEQKEKLRTNLLELQLLVRDTNREIANYENNIMKILFSK